MRKVLMKFPVVALLLLALPAQSLAATEHLRCGKEKAAVPSGPSSSIRTNDISEVIVMSGRQAMRDLGVGD